MERWAVGNGGKSVKVLHDGTDGSYGSTTWALLECELSDNVEERKKQIKAMNNKD